MSISGLKRDDLSGTQRRQSNRCLVLVVDQNLKTYHLHVDADFGVEEVGH